MPVQSVELLLDDATEAWVRNEWRILAGVALPSLKETARPHITLGVAQEIWPRIEQQLRRVPFTPFRLALGPLAVFTRKRSDTGILVRMVVPNADLLGLQSAIHHVIEQCPGNAGHTRPGEWTPHITLARRFPLDAFAVAAHRLAAGHSPVRAVAVRHWDGIRRTESILLDTPTQRGV